MPPMPLRLIAGVKVLCLLFALAVGGVACTSKSIYQDQRYNPPVYWGRHIVKPGETLYSIAWRYGRDYRELGNANGIGAPWHIQAGQVIRLDLRGEIPPQRPAARPTAPASSQTASRPPAPAPTTAAPRPGASTPPSQTRSQAAPATQSSQVVSNISWQWPHVGPVIAGFSTTGRLNKGIDIAGNAGDPVRAAAAGNVVYAGSGLLGYGNLIIINHDEHYLSAYAHNRRILVQEGQNIRAGQVIAELGSSGTDRDKLHFEIRRNGNPVDPVRYLPRR